MPVKEKETPEQKAVRIEKWKADMKLAKERKKLEKETEQVEVKEMGIPLDVNTGQPIAEVVELDIPADLNLPKTDPTKQYRDFQKLHRGDQTTISLQELPIEDMIKAKSDLNLREAEEKLPGESPIPFIRKKVEDVQKGLLQETEKAMFKLSEDPPVPFVAKEMIPVKEPTKQNHMSETAVLEVTKPLLSEIKGRIAIKPYVSGEENMGLEDENQPGGAMVISPDSRQLDRIGCEVVNGFITYFTGLNEQAKEVQLLPEAKKRAKIATIRQVVAYLENSIASNFKVRVETCMDNFGTKDDNFWENVTKFRSSGMIQVDQKGSRIPTYWDGVEVELNNATKVLDKSNPKDLIIYYAIQGQGLSLIAPSLNAAIEARGAYKWYLDQPEETANIQTESIKLKYQAAAALETMRTSDENRLFLVSKMVALNNSSYYKRGGPGYTPINFMYKDMSDYIEGKRGEVSIAAVDRFLEFYKMPIDELMWRAILKDAAEYHLLDTKGDGRTYYKNEALGKTIEDIVEYLSRSINEKTAADLSNAIENVWAE